MSELIRFTKGERLTADKMNKLARLVQRSGSYPGAFEGAGVSVQRPLGGGGGGTTTVTGGGGGVTVLIEKKITKATHNLVDITGTLNPATIVTIASPNHGIKVDDQIQLTWSSGVFIRTGIKVTAVSGNTLTISGGWGETLPTSSTAVVLPNNKRVPVSDPIFRLTPTKFAAKVLKPDGSKKVLMRGEDVVADLVVRTSNEVGTFFASSPSDIKDGEDVFLNWTPLGKRKSVAKVIAPATGKLTLRTGPSTGAITVYPETAHDFIVGALADITWSGGSRESVTVATVVGQVVSFSGGTGTDLPAVDTEPITIDASMFIRVSGADTEGTVLPPVDTEVILTHYQAEVIEYRFTEDWEPPKNHFDLAECPKDSTNKYYFGITSCESIPKFVVPPLVPL